MTNTTVIRNYSRNFLLQVQSVVYHRKPPIPLSVIHTLRQNNICSVTRTHRGVSAGKSKQRPINTITTPGLPDLLHHRDTLEKNNIKSQVSRTVVKPVKSSKSGLCIGLFFSQGTCWHWIQWKALLNIFNGNSALQMTILYILLLYIYIPSIHSPAHLLIHFTYAFN